jgi:hypothetical protein
MHDTTPPNPYEDAIFKHWISSFDPKKIDRLPEEESEVPVDAKFFGGSEAEFIREYRHQLAVLKLRTQSDYSELRTRFHQQQRRLDSLEALVPQVRMQQQQLGEVYGDVRAIKRIVTDLQIDVEVQKKSIFGRITSILNHFWRILFGAETAGPSE